MNTTPFAGLGLAQPLLRAVNEAGYTIPTPIQVQAIPLVLAGADLLAAAQTGTGKTAGFVLPILHRLQGSAASSSAPSRPGRPRCLILTPTRELAAQVEESVRTYGQYVPIKSMVMYGGVGIEPQRQQLRKRVDILVATPGRLLDHAAQRNVDLSAIEILVLDEGDRMLDMGFIPDIRRILALMPKKRQSMLFSATFSDEVRALAKQLLDNPASIDVAPRNTASELVRQSVHLVDKEQKRDVLSHLIRSNGWDQVLVFTRTKHGANRLAEKLDKDGIVGAAIHGNKSQAARTRALAQFKAGDVRVLVATDIAARGLDIQELPHVVNFELPSVAEDYVHRIGRTGRAGSAGSAVSLVDREELPLLRAIEKLLNRPIEQVALASDAPMRAAARRTGEGDAPQHNLRPAPRGGKQHERQRGAQHPQHGRNLRHQPEVGGNRRDAPQAPRNQNRRDNAQGERPRQVAHSVQAHSQAAVHQARPQPALFSPRPQQRRRG